MTEHSGTKNMIPMNARTKAEQKKIATMGGIASGEARRRKKSIRELAAAIGASEIKSDKLKDALRQMGIVDDDMTYNAGIVAVVFREALKGNSKNIDQWLELMGEKRTAIDLNGNVNANVMQHSALDELTVDELRKLKALKQEQK